MTTNRNEYLPQSVSPPGLTLVEKLKELKMGNKEFAVRVGKPEKTITAITKGTSSITPDMAVRFEDVLKIPASFWLERQRHYDEFKARLNRQKDIEQAETWAKKFPYAAMAKLGWVVPTRKIEEKILALFDYFGVSSHKAWEAYYYKQELKVSFRISLAHINEPMAVSAWLRRGEILAQKIDAPAYSKTKLISVLPEIQSLMLLHTEHFFENLQNICLKAGVKVVYTPCLPKAPIHGSSRWIGDCPLIQLSARYKTNDVFWFTFFHEIGHILLHGKKYISIENINFDILEMDKEQEADEFAIKHTFSEKFEKEFLKMGEVTLDSAVTFAQKNNIHPAFILGRLHRKKLLHYSVGREFFESISLE